MKPTETDGDHGTPVSDKSSANYVAPELSFYGQLAALTNGGTSGSDEGSQSGSSYMAMMSDARAKEHVARIGTHPLGFGLYLFDYRPEFARFGRGRQFGVLAQEVEQVLPEAVSIGDDGYRRVDYARLGITRTLN